MPKKYLYIPFAFLILLAAGCAQNTAQVARVYPYPFDSAKIQYLVTGNSSGTRTLYIKGDQVADESHITYKNGNKTEQRDTTTLGLYENSISIDYNSKVASKTQNRLYENLKVLPEKDRTDYIIKLATGNSAPGAVMPIPKGQKEVAGQKCDLYDIQNNKQPIGEVCLWGGIPLYSNITDPNIGGTMTATTIGTNIDIPDSIFTIPTDIKIANPIPVPG
jgi:hypothetical protein